MNAGAYDGEIQDIFASCDVLLADGRVVTMMKEEMAFSYRHSTLQDQHAIILSARFDLAQGIKIKSRNEWMS